MTFTSWLLLLTKRMAVSDIFLGNDLVEVSRILSSIDKIGQRFIDRIYTKHEQESVSYTHLTLPTK